MKFGVEAWFTLAMMSGSTNPSLGELSLNFGFKHPASDQTTWLWLSYRLVKSVLEYVKSLIC